MSIRFIDEFNFDIYIKRELINNIDFKDKVSLENYLKKMFKTLKDKYYIAIEGFYDITIYIDKYYGVVLHLEKDEMDYYEYFKNQVDMKLSIIDTEFIYKIDDIPFNILNKIKIFSKNNNIYIKLKEQLTNLEMMNLLEYSEVTYKKD